MTKNITPYKASKDSKKQQVTSMFNNISKNYDELNRVISFGIDIKWRNKLVDLLTKERPKIILDVATGTGDLAINLTKTGADKIIGLDISPGMLEIGKQKVNKKLLSKKIDMILGDGEKIDFQDNYFDAITVSFGIRNFENLEQGLSEIYRVLKPGGTFAILETSVPTNPIYKAGYSFYTKNILPLIGKTFSKDKVAYQYLSDSAANFPYGEALNKILRNIGFVDVKNYPQTFGVATIYSSSK